MISISEEPFNDRKITMEYDPEFEDIPLFEDRSLDFRKHKILEKKYTSAFQKELRAREIVRLHDEEKLTYNQIGALFNNVFDKKYTCQKYFNVCISPRTIGAIYRKAKQKESKK